MPRVKELGPDETGAAFEAMAELRPHYASLDGFVDRVNGVQRGEGYRLVASFENGTPRSTSTSISDPL